MKNLNQKGFVLAETLIVTVFMMIIFTMIYTELYPIIGLYEQREIYDDLDGEYAAYWIKRIIENDGYDIDQARINERGYERFSCEKISDPNKNQICTDLVNALEINNCRSDGTLCDIFITNFQTGVNHGVKDLGVTYFKDAVNDDSDDRKKRSLENCNNTIDNCKNNYYRQCCEDNFEEEICTIYNNYQKDKNNLSFPDTSQQNYAKKVIQRCHKETDSNIFSSAFKDYVNTLPTYEKKVDPNGSQHRILLVIHHQKDNNNYYSFANMEVK